MKRDGLSKLLTVLLVLSAAACSPTANKLTQSENELSGIIGGAPVLDDDEISKSTVAIVGVTETLKGERGQFICTGSLLGLNFVLTAAHCIPKLGPEYKGARLFVVFHSDIQKVAQEDIRVVTDFMVHPNYGQSGEMGEDNNDIAVLRFNGQMAPGYKRAHLLSDESRLSGGTTVTLAGYGYIETDGTNIKSDDRLRKVDVEVIQNFGKTEVVLDQSQGRGACHGDSGGPAFIEVNGKQMVWGVTSRGSGKDGVDDCSLVSIYTKVSAQMDFIRTAIKTILQKQSILGRVSN